METSIANLSMVMAQSNAMNQVAVKMLDSAITADMQAGMQLVSAMAGMPSPGGAGLGGLLDVIA